ncbi:uncharacterized protein N7443_007505 [Penicillium atrosanguineum]|uniref:S-adenosyl-L-methionine-dependent methyltransferase n=1 Tax=Penicillium atrosanguineum TaxID=1132637 RepID=A0A9W9U146_9EURO|nr:uncharacterized protein N7443_007505 [Penicillium atrosanguineum]KAJ5296612.1 hypothetical protein N7443_007505 [Penicillium atrosanguineum]KAJ5299375.1 hypothetical protein N7476_010932 [Penicillium atrosanguineum]
MAGNTEQIAVDPDFYSMATGYGTEPQDFQSETTSIASAIARGRFENGRRYQATKEDDYWGPSDEQQFEAFEIGHMVFLVLDHNQPNPLFRAPIGEHPKLSLHRGNHGSNVPLTSQYRIFWTLELVKGVGQCIDVADLYPSATVRGVDIFPPPVSWMPPNCVFEVDDVLREWTWRESFDFIHLRLMYGAFAPDGWDQVYKQAYDALEPGGWIEQMEIDVRVYSDDGTLKKEHQLWGWGDMFIRCSERAGRSLRTHETMRSAIEKAGFVDIREEKYKIPLGPWAKDKLLKEAGHLQFAHWNAALEGWAMWLLTHFGEPEPWTKEEVQVYLSKVRKELRDPHIHAYEPGNRVWARKPTKEELKAREASFKVETSP